MSEATILFLAANPVSSANLSLDQEARDIEERIRPRSCPVSLILRTCWAVRPKDVQRALNEARPVVVHFSGDGAGAAGLMLQDASGAPAMVDGAALRELFRAFKEHVRIVVLNACYSEQQAKEIGEEIECVVGMAASIGDRAAKEFAGAFYQALAYGRDVANAVEQGLAAMSLQRTGGLETPRLLVRGGVVASKVLLSSSSLMSVPKAAAFDSVHRDVVPLGSPVDARPAVVHCRFVIRLQGSLADMNGELLAKLAELLRQHSGDMTLLIETVMEGSVRLRIAATEAGRARLLELIRSDELTELLGLEILSVEAEVSPDPLVSGSGAAGAVLPIRPAYLDEVERIIRSAAFPDATLHSHHRLLDDGADLTEVPRIIVAFECSRPLVPGLRLSLGEVDEVLIGRGIQRQWSRENRQLLLAVPDSQMSRLHLRLGRNNVGWTLDDVDSRNGTHVNGARVSRCWLADGDVIEIGRTLIVYRDQAGQQGDPGDRALAAEAIIPKADGGTLFLDEVSELPEESQIALLRLLVEGEMRPTRSAKPVKVNVRVIAATQQDLQTRTAEGRFRRDLYGRLAGYELTVPPLRDRPEDIGSIVAALLRGMAEKVPPELSLHPQAAFALFTYPYPINVRELEQALRAAVSLASDNEIGLEHLPSAIRAHAHTARKQLTPEDVTLRAKLLELFRENQGNLAATARALAEAPVRVQRLCKRLGIDPGAFRRH